MASMRTLTVTLETVTPLFLGGAEPRGTPELRPPAFRGALRYWLRAALGGVVGDQDLSVLHRLESAVFGSTDEKAGGASTITVRLNPRNLLAPQLYKKQPPVLVEKEGQARRQPTGHDYLYWSMGESGNQQRDNYQPPKQFYAPGASFDLTLSSRPGVKEVEQQFRQAVAALWLLLHFGGIGSRSRRTAGSLSVRESIVAEGLTFTLAADVTQAAAQLGAGLSTIRQQFSTLGHVPLKAPSAFDSLHPAVCRIWVLGTWKSSDAAVDTIGAAVRDFRTYREPDHANVAKWLTGQAIPTVERAAFGLPLPYRYSGGGLSGTVQGNVRPPVIDRRASPLWLKVSKASSSGYVGIATLFKAAFLPPGEQLHVKTRGVPSPIPPPADYRLIENFITESFPQCQEVPYV